MIFSLKETLQQDWITILLFICFAIACISEFIATRGFVRSWNKHSITLKANGAIEMDKVFRTLPVFNRLCILLILISLQLHIHFSQELNIDLNLKDLLIVLAALIVFFICKFYVTRFIALLFKLNTYHDAYQHMKDYMLGVSGYLMLITFMVYQYTPVSISTDQFTVTNVCILSVFIGVIFYRARIIILRKWYQFILYLCTLEILPYLLLYKYFIG